MSEVIKNYVYLAEAQLNDGSSVVLDLEEHGWADRDLLSRTVRFSLVPKDDAPVTASGRPYPVVSVAIPEGGKATFSTRVYRKMGANDMATLIDFRCYRVGYHLDGVTHWTWVMPTGDIEVSTLEESFLADSLFAHLVSQLH